jgi:hypothetical protein
MEDGKANAGNPVSFELSPEYRPEPTSISVLKIKLDLCNPPQFYGSEIFFIAFFRSRDGGYPKRYGTTACPNAVPPPSKSSLQAGALENEYLHPKKM